MKYAHLDWILFLFTIGSTYGCLGSSPTASIQSPELSKTEALIQPECAALSQRIGKTPFYHAANSRFGTSTVECNVQNERQDLKYAFEHGAKLEIRIQPQIELEEQRLVVNGLSTKEALELLRAAEHYSFANQSCGIVWDAAPESTDVGSNYERIYRGNVCNCQARMFYRNDEIVGLTFSRAC